MKNNGKHSHLSRSKILSHSCNSMRDQQSYFIGPFYFQQQIRREIQQIFGMYKNMPKGKNS